jgi:AcrR family transcriptional regulator
MSAPDRKDQILDVTAAIVAADGFSAVSIQRVARAAEISRPIVYEHFGDLAGLLDTLIERETARAFDQAEATTPGDLLADDPAAMMLDSLRAFLEAVRSHPDTWRLVLMAPEGAPESLRQSITDGRAQILARLNESVAPLLLAADAPFDPELTAQILSALADEYARLLLTDPAEFNPERLLAHATVIVEHVAALDSQKPPGPRAS